MAKSTSKSEGVTKSSSKDDTSSKNSKNKTTFRQLQAEGVFSWKSKRKFSNVDSKFSDAATQTDFTYTAKAIAIQSQVISECTKFSATLLNANFKLLKMDNPDKFRSFEDFENELKGRVKRFYDLCNEKGDKEGWVIEDDELD